MMATALDPVRRRTVLDATGGGGAIGPANSNWIGFPTKHPLTPDPTGTGMQSNVRLGTFEHEGRHYVVPTMVEGVDLSKDSAAFRLAMDQGLDKYPWFHTAQEALEWSKAEHANIAADGSWKREQ